MAEQGSIRAEQYLAPETLSQLTPFELRAKMIVEGVMNGMHRSPYQGLAVEFAEHRQYVPGDETRHLDWKVYGRTYKVLSSAKLQMSDLRFENKRSFINMLNNIGPSIEPCGTPKTMVSQSLTDELMRTL